MSQRKFSSFQAHVNGECVGAIVCKLDYHKKIVKRGYIAMLAVDSGHRKRKIGSTLVKRAIDAMKAEDADEVYNRIMKYPFIFDFLESNVFFLSLMR